jgi:hypothetical protein
VSTASTNQSSPNKRNGLSVLLPQHTTSNDKSDDVVEGSGKQNNTNHVNGGEGTGSEGGAIDEATASSYKPRT